MFLGLVIVTEGLLKSPYEHGTGIDGHEFKPTQVVFLASAGHDQ